MALDPLFEFALKCLEGPANAVIPAMRWVGKVGSYVLPPILPGIVNEPAHPNWQHGSQDKTAQSNQRPSWNDLRVIDEDYRVCMVKFDAAISRYGGTRRAAEKVYNHLNSSQPSREARELDACRSVCRQYWMRAHEAAPGLRFVDRDVLASRHMRFVATVKPFDDFTNYAGDDMASYRRL